MYKSFELLSKLYFVRTGGSMEEDRAADILIEECKSLGVDAVKEEFLVDGYNEFEAKLSFSNPDLSLECVVVGQSGSTEGTTGKFRYVSSYEDALVQDLKDSICLVHSKLANYKIYKKIVEKGAIGMIVCTGSVYDEAKDVDLDPYMLRERHYKNGKIPAVCIRMKDAEKLLRLMPETATIVVKQEELQKTSRDVVATIEGTTYPDEVVAFTAHYDSVSYSKGAYDNATGSTAIMQLLAYFKENKPKRTLKFIWCGSEEMGLLGSKAYCKAHEEELKKYVLNINCDMIGVTIGNDIACVSANNSLVNFINYTGLINGFAISARQGVYSSDSTPFADSGVPSLSFARLSPTGGAVIHSHKDVMDYLSEANYYKTLDFWAMLSSMLVNSVAFPVEREIPSNVKDDLDKYMGRKD